MRNHPRLRGEHYNKFNNIRKEKGSPPPTRGTRWYRFSVLFKTRITPAYAGNTKNARHAVRFYRDHPRLRGEHEYNEGKELRRLGSSPPTRGTLINMAKQNFNFRIIPAYAGNTALRVPIWTVHQDHPRIRGEHSKSRHCILTRLGSPPHTRGTLVCNIVDYVTARITPAYAGNTAIFILSLF